MSEHQDSSGRPLDSSNPEDTSFPPQSTSPLRKRRKDSQSSDERIGGTKASSSQRRRPGQRKEASFGPHPGGEQSSTMPPSMSPETASVHYTRTGRISKAKKGLKVHNCECGRSYTRAEHLRIDLLQRHQERHNEIAKDSRRASLYSQGAAPETDAQVSASVPIQAPMTTSLPPSTPTPYYQTLASEPPEATTPNPRYTPQFRTPQMPSSAFGSLRSSPNSNVKQPLRNTYSRQPNVVIPADGSVVWNEHFNQSPNCSSSSGYASPVPGADFSNMFANPAYNRTRTSSNASFIEPWGFPSRSPTSATSTLGGYTWTSNEKSSAPIAYMNSSYSVTSVPLSNGVDHMPGYGFGPKSMTQRDEEEQAFLFPEQSFGMGLADYPSEQYLDNFWRLFPFPVVHRATSRGINESPMLRAAMIAIGAQYSNDACAKRKARILHDRCMKLLDKRDLDVMTEPERTCDYQALFLIEVLSQYRARRAAKTLSTRFEGLYQKFHHDFRAVASALVDNVHSLVQQDSITYDHWAQWIELSCQQRLLLCCYILEYQQAIFLARSGQQSLIQTQGFDLPFPAHSSLWDAENSTEWAIAAQQYTPFPAYVFQVTPEVNIGPLDSFQSSLLIAAHYNHFNNPVPYLSPSTLSTIDHLLDASPITRHQLWTAKLLQVTPIRALLGIAGESWILSEKVPSVQEFSTLKTTLRAWLNQLWAPTADSQESPTKDALKWSIEILQQAMLSPVGTLRLEGGADMGLYFAALVLWAVTVVANTRINPPHLAAGSHRYLSHSPLPSNRNSTHYPSTPTTIPGSPLQVTTTPNPAHPNALGLIPAVRTSPAPHSSSNSMLHSEVTMTSISFLNTALMELELLGTIPQWPKDVAQWQQGCSALLRWVKMRLRNGSMEGLDKPINSGPTSAGTGLGGDGCGELLDGVIGVLEKILGRGWD
ncbi:hypothetical protein EJ04DRAFT_525440 [Polyplosphaeria fusca]|uniref:Xylanolytic transcriptional activator regulatory domain-containing protein n=1 Tax=Polyplosphaeria fusca TaxID=682080 RepID=A0A9P4QR85_9PLEO|nr:hypothetical protein EJ04DRAFT_525440 [Polyplosphaeria fusca]